MNLFNNYEVIGERIFRINDERDFLIMSVKDKSEYWDYVSAGIHKTIRDCPDFKTYLLAVDEHLVVEITVIPSMLIEYYIYYIPEVGVIPQDVNSKYDLAAESGSFEYFKPENDADNWRTWTDSKYVGDGKDDSFAWKFLLEDIEEVENQIQQAIDSHSENEKE